MPVKFGDNIDPDTGSREHLFREEVRMVLEMDSFTRDYQIFEELKRLKRVDREAVKNMQAGGATTLK